MKNQNITYKRQTWMSFKYGILLFLALFIVVVAFPSSASAMSITVDVLGKYSEVKAGEEVFFQTEVKWPENDSRKDLRIEYSVVNKDGNEVAYLKVLKAIETQASFMDSITIPKNIPSGMYTINAGFNDYGDLNQKVSTSFNVTKTNNNVQNSLFIVIGILVVILLLVFVAMFTLLRRVPQNSSIPIRVFEPRVQVL